MLDYFFSPVSFTLLPLVFMIPLKLTFVYGMQKGSRFSPFPLGYPTDPVLFAENTAFPPWMTAGPLSHVTSVFGSLFCPISLFVYPYVITTLS